MWLTVKYLFLAYRFLRLGQLSLSLCSKSRKLTLISFLHVCIHNNDCLGNLTSRMINYMMIVLNGLMCTRILYFYFDALAVDDINFLSDNKNYHSFSCLDGQLSTLKSTSQK